MPSYTVTTPAPDGWRWVRRPNQNSYGEWEPGTLSYADDPAQSIPNLEGLFTRLVSWAEQYESLIQESSEPESVGGGIWAVKNVTVYPHQRSPEHVTRYWPNVSCRHGHDHGPRYTAIACNHGDDPELIADTHRSEVVVGHVLWTPEFNAYRSIYEVARCNQPVSRDVVAQRRTLPEYANYRTDYNTERRMLRCNKGVDTRFTVCSDCVPRETCVRCNSAFPENHGLRDTNGDRAFRCTDCWNYYCNGCDNWQTGTSPCLTIPEQDGRFCGSCRATINQERYEEYDGEIDNLPATVLGLPSDPHRPIRMCSIEVETVEGGQTLARVLSQAGLAGTDQVLGYHSSGATDGFCHVEFDRSLGTGGGELIFDRIRLDNSDDVSKLHQALALVRQQIKAGELQVSLSCGLHVHVDAHQFGIGDARNLVLVTNYLEDVIFRLSAARYKRHRGTQYAIPLPKGPFADRRQFGVSFFSNNGHHSALNLGHYWEAMRSRCVCGAVTVGEHETCTCNLGKCTFEFRHFNGTANFRKIHAYAALCQSLVSFAKTADDLVETEFPPQEYDGRHAHAGAAKKDKWEERLRWMLTNLYFSPNERESLRYCVNHSALAELGEPRIESIFETAYVVPDKPRQTITHRNPRGSAPSGATFRSRQRVHYSTTSPFRGLA